MKKLSLFLAALVLMLSQFNNSNAQPIQDFESLTFPPTGWTLEYTGTQYWTRQAFTSYVPPQTGAAKFNFFSATNGTIQSLVTPTLSASVAGDSVKFDLSYHSYTAAPNAEIDSLIIEASSDNGSTYTTVQQLLGGSTVGTGMVTWATSTSSAAPTLASQWANFKYALPVGTNKIRFRACSDFGNNLYIDNIKTRAVNTAINNDISAVSIDNPVPLSTILTGTTIPLATFSNVGLLNQVNIPVKCIITGPVNFTGTVNIAALASGASTQASFNSPAFSPTIGSYNITVYSELGTDGFRANDTLRSTFTVVDANWGSGTGGNFFANSISVGAPSKPEVCWPGYADGTNLCLDGTNNFPADFTGTLDDGYWKVGSIMPAGYHVRLNGVNYDSIFPSTNGIIGLTNNAGLTDFSPGTLPDAGQTVALFPLWKDFHFVTLQGNTYIKYMVRGTRLYVFWLGATYNSGLLSLDRVFFGASIDLVNGATDSRVTYQYGDLSKGTTASFVAAVNANTLADHVIGLQSGAVFFTTYRQRVTTLTKLGPIFSTPAGGELAVEFGPNATLLNQKCSSLGLSVAMQDFGCDATLNVSLFSSSCGLIDSKDVTLPTGSSGPLNISFAGVDNSPSTYYIRVRQKNSLEIWSNPISFTGYAGNYNFTTAQSQELNGVLIFNGSNWAMISGDVNQDQIVDAADQAPVENDAFCGSEMCASTYPTDVNCDGVVDAADQAIVENNVGFFAAPPCSPSDYMLNEKVPAPSEGYISLPEVDKSNPDAVKLYEYNLRHNIK